MICPPGKSVAYESVMRMYRMLCIREREAFGKRTLHFSAARIHPPNEEIRAAVSHMGLCAVKLCRISGSFSSLITAAIKITLTAIFKKMSAYFFISGLLQVFFQHAFRC